MAEPEPPAARRALERALDAMERRDLEAALAAFDDDAVVEDPHYPRARMRGRAALAAGLAWALATLERPRFEVGAWLVSADGDSAAVEVRARHVVRGGLTLDTPQGMFVDTRGGRIVRLRVYAPHGTGGVAGAALLAARLARRG